MDAKKIADGYQRRAVSPNLQPWEVEVVQLAADYLRLRAENEALKASNGNFYDYLAKTEKIADLTRKLGESERWETGFRNIVTALIGPRTQFEIPQVVEMVQDLIRQRDLVCEAHDHDVSGLDGMVRALTTRAETAERDLTTASGNAKHYSDMTLDLERQNAAMRGTLEHIGNSELMGIKYARRIALAALQPAPEPPDPDAETGTADDRLTHGFAVAADKILRDSTSAPQPGTAEWIKQRAARLGITPAEWAKAYCDITPEQVRAVRREQAISFAYGNVKMHNPDLTRESVAAEYDKVDAIQPAAEPKP